MDRAEAEHRDRVLRAYFEGRDWSGGAEFTLIRELVISGHALLEGFPFLVDYEWEVEQGRSQEGRGDLLFANGEGNFAVVEAKWIDLDSSGKTSRRRRTGHRGKVFDQAYFYAEQAWLAFDAQTVEAMTLTNEEGLRVVGRCTCGECLPLG
jgi:hypothetical protein